ncbi:MAG TPA: hypothetical protein V6D12_05170 [Candidatus Obscuribacterales bacterium]
MNKVSGFTNLRDRASHTCLTMTTIPDRISTLELSKLWIYKALQELEAQRNLKKPTKDES